MRLRELAVISMLAAAAALTWEFSLGRGQSRRREGPAVISRTPEEFQRSPDNTFLTFPEWFLVWSPREYADYIQGHGPSGFPFLGHIGQFWQGYGVVYDATKDKQPFNFDYHSMIWVIGASITGEYAATRMYETIVGRVSEASVFEGPTAEDQLAARVAADYAAYLDKEPFYKFDYVTPLKQVWTETGFAGKDPVRKYERKYFLTTQYAFKACYGWFIKKSSESAYGLESHVTVVVLDRVPMDIGGVAPKVLDRFADGTALVELPRYQAFTPAAMAIAQSGENFIEIAGNRGALLITAIVPVTFADGRIHPLFMQPIITKPGKKRIAFTVEVSNLSATLLRLEEMQIEVEHIYDF